MKPLLAAIVTAIAIGVVAAVVLNNLGMDAASQYTTPSVRL